MPRAAGSSLKTRPGPLLLLPRLMLATRPSTHATVTALQNAPGGPPLLLLVGRGVGPLQLLLLLLLLDQGHA